ncbi:MAG: hypothetical protein KAI40_03295 [Desulfobacterales bacterium]|nr:hypothetical protein [Desulfobacterales bacterium]
MISINVTVKDIERALYDYLKKWKGDQGSYGVVTKDTDPKQYARSVAPVFFDMLIQAKGVENKQSTIDFLKAFSDLYRAMKAIFDDPMLSRKCGMFRLSNWRFESLRGSFDRVDRLLGGGAVEGSAGGSFPPAPSNQKNKSKSNHPGVGAEL